MITTKRNKIENDLVRHTWDEKSLIYNYTNAYYEVDEMNIFVKDPSVKSNLNSSYFDSSDFIFNYINKRSLQLDEDFLRKHAFYKFSTSYYLDYCWEQIDDILQKDELEQYNYSIYYDAETSCIFLMDKITIKDILVKNEEIRRSPSNSYCKAELMLGLEIEETKNKKEIINLFVDALSCIREDDIIFNYLQESSKMSVTYHTYMPSGSYEATVRDVLIGRHLSDALKLVFDEWNEIDHLFMDEVAKTLFIKNKEWIDYNVAFASGLTFGYKDFDEIAEEIIEERTDTNEIIKYVNMDRILEMFKDYENEFIENQVCIYKSKEVDTDLYIYKEDNFYYLPVYFLFHALSMQGFYTDNEIHSFIDTIINMDEFLSPCSKNIEGLELLICSKNDILYSTLEEISDFIKYDDNDKNLIKIAIKINHFDDLWITRENIDRIVNETFQKEYKNGTVSTMYYVSIYNTMEEIEMNSMYSFGGKHIYVDERLAKSNYIYLYAEINIE